MTNSDSSPASGDNKPNKSMRREITKNDLPLHCPMDGDTLWDAHPRVYLPIEDSSEELCPYCGTVYVLVDK